MISHKSLFSFISVIDLVLVVIMIGFTIWNTSLACIGSNSIEIISSKTDYDFRFESIWDNLYSIFATKKIARMLSPSMRNVPFTGLEWSFLMKDLGFD